MNGKDEGIGWPSAVVAGMLVALVGTVTVTAIIRYDVDSALKVWAALGSVVGLLTGAFVTYFFTRGTVEAEKKNAATAQAHADEAERQAAAARNLADDRLAGLAHAAGLVDKDLWKDTVATHGVLSRALKE
jgi:hypothetical protein